ncbi:MAG: hypothetical protein ACRDY0_00740 [Acidimicrobiales bacterium]
MPATPGAAARPPGRSALGWAHGGAAVAVVAAGAGLLVLEARFRLFEASSAAALMRLTHLADAHTLGSAVVFVQGQRWVGYSIATACTAALLIAPFFLVGAAVLVSRKVPVRRALMALAIVSVVVWAVNQARLLLIGASMQLWGFQTGYSRSHVLAGGVLSTMGVAAGIAVFAAILLRRPSPPPAPPAHV